MDFATFLIVVLMYIIVSEIKTAILKMNRDVKNIEGKINSLRNEIYSEENK